MLSSRLKLKIPLITGATGLFLGLFFGFLLGVTAKPKAEQIEKTVQTEQQPARANLNAQTDSFARSKLLQLSKTLLPLQPAEMTAEPAPIEEVSTSPEAHESAHLLEVIDKAEFLKLVQTKFPDEGALETETNPDGTVNETRVQSDGSAAFRQFSPSKELLSESFQKNGQNFYRSYYLSGAVKEFNWSGKPSELRSGTFNENGKLFHLYEYNPDGKSKVYTYDYAGQLRDIIEPNEADDDPNSR